MSHPDLIRGRALTRDSVQHMPLTYDELTVLAEALTEFAMRMPAGSGRRVVTDALFARIGLLLANL